MNNIKYCFFVRTQVTAELIYLFYLFIYSFIFHSSEQLIDDRIES